MAHYKGTGSQSDSSQSQSYRGRLTNSQSHIPDRMYKKREVEAQFAALSLRMR